MTLGICGLQPILIVLDGLLMIGEDKDEIVSSVACF